MEVRPVLSALRRNKVGAILIALQMAVTLAILTNAVYVVQERLALIARPTGVDEADVFTIENDWIGKGTGARLQADLDALRAIPGVVSAFASNMEPLNDGGMTLGITLHPDNQASILVAGTYLGDQNALRTFGSRLAAGRDFTQSDIQVVDDLGQERPPLSGILVTRDLANKLSPGGAVLGRVATLFPFSIHAPIVGIIDRLQVPFVNAPRVGSFVEDSMILPYRPIGVFAYYIVRVQPDRLAQVMKAAPAALAAVSHQRVIGKVRSLIQARQEIYHGDRTVALMLALVCAVLVAVTAFGIVGLTSYWVSQRRRQIGIRRSLGATRYDIVRYFQTENVLITSVGILVGIALSIAGNLWLVERFATGRLPGIYLITGIVSVFLLGQLAVLWPAMRAAAVAPATAIRAV
jgi:putative ABC transport system permease protein